MADIEKTTFRAVGASDEKMHGASGLILAGAAVWQQEAVRLLMDQSGLKEIPLSVVTAETLELTLAEHAALPTGSGVGVKEKLPLAVIASGLTERQFHDIMNAYRESGMPRPIWATVTPNSEEWTVKHLLIELINERKAMREAMERAKREEAQAGSAE